MTKTPRQKAMVATIIILLIIVADQALKLWVKTHFYLGEDYPITSWFHLKFIENNGIAFGIELMAKLFLTIGRLLAVIALLWLIYVIRKATQVRMGFVICMALITAGAAGNIIDCIFYGQLFNNPMPPEVASFLPASGGYASWFEGQVVDMLYFPLFNIEIAGYHWEFFQYIFNLADASICVGVFAMILFYSKDFSKAWEYIATRFSRKKCDTKQN